MLDNVFINCQSSIKISSNKIIYFDPYLIKDKRNDADIIFITHDHYDHFDLESINKIIKKDTILVVPNTMVEKVSNLFDEYEILGVDPDKEYNVYDINFNTIRAYNNEKKFHPKDNNWVGYIIYLDNISYYIMGDTDDTVDARRVKCDYVFIPIGGTYTMNYLEASNYINYIKPKVVIPIHYKTVVGSEEDYNGFIDNLDKSIKNKKYI
jgi:L-ascorbate metabolism protein UlaG (beta-lactamase superfamily)